MAKTKSLSKSAIAALKDAKETGHLRFCYGGPCTGDVSYFLANLPYDPNRSRQTRHYCHIVTPLVEAGLLKKSLHRWNGFSVYHITEAGETALTAQTAN